MVPCLVPHRTPINRAAHAVIHAVKPCRQCNVLGSQNYSAQGWALDIRITEAYWLHRRVAAQLRQGHVHSDYMYREVLPVGSPEEVFDQKVPRGGPDKN